MGKKRLLFNIRMIKATLSYSIPEAAAVCRVHKRTVEEWLRTGGLKKIDDRRPFLIRGTALIAFLKERQKDRKRPCKTDELFCLRCAAPQRSRDNVVDIKILSKGKLMIIGCCRQCGKTIYKAGSVKRLNEIRQTYTVREIQGEHLPESDHPHQNNDLTTGEKVWKTSMPKTKESNESILNTGWTAATPTTP